MKPIRRKTAVKSSKTSIATTNYYKRTCAITVRNAATDKQNKPKFEKRILPHKLQIRTNAYRFKFKTRIGISDIVVSL